MPAGNVLPIGEIEISYTKVGELLRVIFDNQLTFINNVSRGGSRAAATSKMESFVIIVNGFQPLTIITKRSILDAAAGLDPPLVSNLCKSVGVNFIFLLELHVV